MSVQLFRDGRLGHKMLIEVILAYLTGVVGPNQETWRLWLAIMGGGTLLCVLLTLFHVS
jgi:hypothetical protein